MVRAAVVTNTRLQNEALRLLFKKILPYFESLHCVKASEQNDFKMVIKDTEMQLIYAGEIKASIQNILPTKTPPKQPKHVGCQTDTNDLDCLNYSQNNTGNEN